MRIMRKTEIIQFVRMRHELFDAAGRSNPFACSAWVLNFIDQVAGDDWDFHVFESLASGESLMLLYVDPATPRRLAGVTNYYSSLYSPLIGTASDCRAPLKAIIREIADARPKFDSLDLAPLDDGAIETRLLQEELSNVSWYAKRYSCFGNWYLPVSEMSFEQYMTGRPSQVRNTWARKLKKFQAGSARLEIVTDTDRSKVAMEAFQHVYAKSWKNPEPFPEFVPRWADICARNGWLRMGLAWVGDVPIAAQFWFTKDRRSYIFKLAYDDEYGKWSAGTILSTHMMRHSLENDRVIEVDYLTGDDDYKKSWMTARRERIGIRGCNLSSARGLALAAYEMAGDVRRKWFRKADR